MAHYIDISVGKRVRQRRWLVGMSQHQLAEQIGVKFQQVQKYETGANRISASRLWDIARVLDMPVHYFFEGVGPSIQEQSDETYPVDILADKEALNLVRAYYSIPESHRRKLYDLAKVMAA